MDGEISFRGFAHQGDRGGRGGSVPSSGGGTVRVSVSSAIRWVEVWRRTGRTAPYPRGGDRRSGRIEGAAGFLLDKVEETPDITLADRMNRVAAPEGGRRGLGHAEIADLALFDQPGHGADGVLDGNVGTPEFLSELGRIDIVLAPIDGMWTMSHEELFEVCRTCPGVCPCDLP